MKKVLIALAAALGLVGTAYAHGGHGSISTVQLLHYLLEPVHSLPALVLTAGSIAVIRFRRKAALSRSSSEK